MSITTLNDWNGVSLRVTTHDDAKKELDRYLVVYARDEEDALNVARNNGFNPTYKKHCRKSLVMQTRKPFVYIDKDYRETDEPRRLSSTFRFLSDALDILKIISENKPSIDREDNYRGVPSEKSITISREDLEQEGIFCSEKAEGIDAFFWITKVFNKEGEELFDFDSPQYYTKKKDTYRIDIRERKITYFVTGQQGNCLEECGYDLCNPEFVLWKVKVS